MAMLIQARSFADLVTEAVARRSGILLADHDVIEILAGTELESFSPVFSADPTSTVRIRPELLDDIIRIIRAGIGNLPDATPATLIRVRKMKEIFDHGLDIGDSLAIVQAWWSAGRPLEDRGLLDLLVLNTSLPTWAARNVVDGFIAHFEREVNLFHPRQRSVDWDGDTPLQDLFEQELLPSDPELYLDQRFIDYLAAREGTLARIHWRNFERLVAEYFKRRGHFVQLGPGSKDGGVDIRVWSDEAAAAGPPLLLIQCKRYSAGRKVKVEYVKAPYADVLAEGSQGAVLATTSYVAPDGKRLASARQYPVEIAERDKIASWIRGMWRHPWTGQRKTEGVGRYLLPHPLVIFGPDGVTEWRRSTEEGQDDE